MVASARRLAALSAATVLAAALLAGCGSQESAVDASGDTTSMASTAGTPPTAAATPSASATSPTAAATPAWPACDATWKQDGTLPQRYHGCLRDGSAVPAVALRCSTGVQLITFDDRFWAVPGHRIQSADGSIRHDPEFTSTRATCTA